MPDKRLDDKGNVFPEMAPALPGDPVRHLTGNVLMLEHRLKRVEDHLETQDGRLEALEVHHRQYMESVGTLRLHFDGELHDLKGAQRSLLETVGDIRTMVLRLDTLIRIEDGGKDRSLITRIVKLEDGLDSVKTTHLLDMAEHLKRHEGVYSKVMTLFMHGVQVVIGLGIIYIVYKLGFVVLPPKP